MRIEQNSSIFPLIFLSLPLSLDPTTNLSQTFFRPLPHRRAYSPIFLLARFLLSSLPSFFHREISFVCLPIQCHRQQVGRLIDGALLESPGVAHTRGNRVHRHRRSATYTQKASSGSRSAEYVNQLSTSSVYFLVRYVARPPPASALFRPFSASLIPPCRSLFSALSLPPPHPADREPLYASAQREFPCVWTGEHDSCSF